MGLAAAAGIGAVASIGSAVIGSSAAKKGADAQAEAARYAADLQDRQYQQSREDMAPWRAAGGKAIGSLSDMLQPGYDHTTSPGYDFRRSEGLRAVEGSAASRGMLMSGGTLKDIYRFADGTAADDYDRQFNRTASVAAGGQQVNSDLGRLGATAAGNAGSAMMAGGQARASGYLGQANAITAGLGNLAYLAQSGAFGGGGGFNSGAAVSSAMNSMPAPITPFSSPNLSSGNWRDW